jgi:hypothetical protein
MVEETQPHVRVTLQTIYDKQLDNEKLLVRTLSALMDCQTFQTD